MRATGSHSSNELLREGQRTEVSVGARPLHARAFIRSLGNLQHLDTGFVRDKVLIVMMDPRAAYGKDVDKYGEMYRELPRRVEQLPGVKSASFADGSFFGASVSRGNVAYEGYPQQVPQGDYPFKLRITPRFFDTFGVPLLAGRTFTDRDDRESRQVVVVSESVAKRYYGGHNAVGRRLCFSDRFDPRCGWEIVGIVKGRALQQPAPGVPLHGVRSNRAGTAPARRFTGPNGRQPTGVDSGRSGGDTPIQSRAARASHRHAGTAGR